MEYRRRRTGSRINRVYRSRTRRDESDGSLFNLIILIILTIGLIYLLVATPVGNWLVGTAFKIKGTASVGTALPQGTPVPTVSASPLRGEVKSEQMTLPALNEFALQIGIYESEENAKGLISSLKSLGAAGYCMKTDAGVRILASCYDTEAAASSVAKRLNEQGYECVVYPISSNALQITATAQEEQLSSVHSAVELAHGIIDSLSEEVIRFDSEERSPDYGFAVANEMLERIRAVRATLDNVHDGGNSIELINEYYIELTGAFTRFLSSDTDNRVELSGKLKYLQIEAIDCYRKLLEAISPLQVGV